MNLEKVQERAQNNRIESNHFGQAGTSRGDFIYAVKTQQSNVVPKRKMVPPSQLLGKSDAEYHIVAFRGGKREPKGDADD